MGDRKIRNEKVQKNILVVCGWEQKQRLTGLSCALFQLVQNT